MTMPDPTFPPLLSGHGVPEAESAFEHACTRAATGEAGAGDVFWGREEANIQVSIVLEPEVPMETAAQMLPLCLVALGDCLGALTPPQVGVTFIWPNVVCINGAPAAAFRAAAAATENETEVPGWMVIGVELHHMRKEDDLEPGQTPDRTWLSEEGGGELTRTDIAESYARHFLTWLNIWNDDGFKPVHEAWTFRAETDAPEMSVHYAGSEHKGEFVGLDEMGNLLLKGDDGAVTEFSLEACFDRPGAGG